MVSVKGKYTSETRPTFVKLDAKLAFDECFLRKIVLVELRMYDVSQGRWSNQRVGHEYREYRWAERPTKSFVSRPDG